MINTENLEAVAASLRKVITQQLNFDISGWGMKHPTCGTTACAMGWHCLLNEQANVFFRAWDARDPECHAALEWRDVSRYVGDSRLADNLFMGTSYSEGFHVGPVAVLARVEATVSLAADYDGGLVDIDDIVALGREIEEGMRLCENQ